MTIEFTADELELIRTSLKEVAYDPERELALEPVKVKLKIMQDIHRINYAERF